MTSIEVNHKQMETARKGQEVCIKIEPIPGDSPKLLGRHFEETDIIVSKVKVPSGSFQSSLNGGVKEWRETLAHL